jgi:hypothetical protein
VIMTINSKYSSYVKYHYMKLKCKEHSRELS